ncbi:TonB-dependent receptor [Parapedobacter koreensis]|uniref:TonB-linked outer membrane protein, SusC/RagA family n=1 Tax=Parapedobacter koreensis TaxID=332977 RepID=A0A1H7RSA0_9SPHI|nr:TonB-dependent receptor [Parapedobacter koreensis]SEL62888.1 TonB-linked outer membrane protein, SusC/RagA family [Parapedobacter koreensis]
MKYFLIGNDMPTSKCWHVAPTKFLLAVKITFYLLIAFVTGAYAEGRAQKVTLSLKNANLEQVFREITKQTDYRFLYSDEVIQLSDLVSIYVKNAEIQHVLDHVIHKQGMAYKIISETIIVTPPKMQFANLKKEVSKQEEVAISGTVKDATGAGLTGATVTVKNQPNIGTKTDGSGNFALRVPKNAVIQISYIGYLSKEVTTTNEGPYDIQLQEDASQLDEVIVVGYGEQSKRTVTGAITRVDGETLKDLPMPSPDQMLQGRAPGVQVTANSGEPGGGIIVRVRGSTSINASSEPLYVIDGVPIVSENLARSSFGQPTNPLADINPADIESMEVLKDAAATAIYGARAANGVVLITTKRGAAGKPTVSISTYVGTSKAWRDPNELRVDGPTYELLKNEAAGNNWIDRYGSIDALDGSGNAFAPPYANPANAVNTNWIDYIMQRGSVYNIDASIAGGNDRIRYMVSANNFDQDGIMKLVNFKRRSFRTNLDFSASDNLKFGTSIFYSNSRRNRIQNGNSTSSALANAFFYPTNLPAYNEDGSYNKPLWESPLAIVNETDYLMDNTRIIGNFFADWTIIKGLVFRTTWSLDNSYVNEDNYSNTKMVAGAGVGGSASSSAVNDFNWINENLLTYKISLQNAHNLDVLAGTTFQKNRNAFTSATGQGFPSDSFRKVSSAATRNSSGDENEWAIASVFGRVNYDYNQKYLLSANLRYDGSSRFGANNRWGLFPSASVGWIMSDEAFMEPLSVISLWKWRVSYGVTGNQSGIDNYASLGLWGGQQGGYRGGGGATPGSGGAASYGDYAGLSPVQLANPDLKWETTTQLDIGVDLAFFKGKLNVSVDYYDKQTEDLLLEVPIPRSTGYSSMMQNYGEIENKGIEFGINAAVFAKEDFGWDIGLNISRNRNLVKRLASPFNQFTRDYVRIEEGYPLYSFYVHEQLGVDPQTGNVIWRTRDGESTFNVNRDRFISSRNAWPDFQGGLSNNFRYKNFDLTTFLQFSYGNYVFNYNRYFMEHGGEQTYGFMAQQLDRWQNPGDITDIPRMASVNYNTNYRPSRHVEDASYLRLKNVSLGYALPANLSRKIGASQVRFYISGQNLLTFTRYSGLDPEVSVGGSALTIGIDQGVMPQPRLWMGGLNLTF